MNQLRRHEAPTSVELHLLDAPDGQKYVDVAQLEQKGIRPLGFGRETYIPTRVSDVDPEGRLTYRDYRIGDLVEKSNYEETAYLLLRGELPNREELADFKKLLAEKAVLSPQIQQELVTVLKATHVHDRTNAMSLMNKLVAVMHDADVDARGNPLDVRTASARYETAVRTMAVMPTLLGLVNARLKAGNNPNAIDDYHFAVATEFGKDGQDFSYAKLLLSSLRQQPVSDLPPEHVRAVDQYLILHAEHGHNLSSFGATVAGSAETKEGGWLFTQAGIANLAGNQHGNASVDALRNLQHILTLPGDGEAAKVDHYLADMSNRIDAHKAAAEAAKGAGKTFDEPQPVIEGVGHAIYRALDPRARTFLDVLKNSGVQTPLLNVAVMLSDRLHEHPKFGKKPGRPLEPNVDFFSGVLLTQYLGIDERLMTSMFAVARDVGWHAHVNEHKLNQGKSIIRPNAMYMTNNPEGTRERDFIELNDRRPPTEVEAAQLVYEASGKVAIPALGKGR